MATKLADMTTDNNTNGVSTAIINTQDETTVSLVKTFSNDVNDIEFADMPTPRLSIAQGMSKQVQDRNSGIGVGDYIVPMEDGSFSGMAQVTLIPISLAVSFDRWEGEGDKARLISVKRSPENKNNQPPDTYVNYSYLMYVIETRLFVTFDMNKSSANTAKAFNAALKHKGFRQFAATFTTKSVSGGGYTWQSPEFKLAKLTADEFQELLDKIELVIGQ